MGEHDDRRRFRKAGEVGLHPCELFRADFRPSARDVVEGDEVNAAMIERIVSRPHEFAEHIATVERCVILTRHYFDLSAANFARDRFAQFEALGVLVRRIRVMSEIAGDDYQLGAILQPINRRYRVLERLGAQRIWRPVETDVSVAELHKGKRRRRFAVQLREGAGQRLASRVTRERWEHAVKSADTERSSRYAQERSTIKLASEFATHPSPLRTVDAKKPRSMRAFMG